MNQKIMFDRSYLSSDLSQKNYQNIYKNLQKILMNQLSHICSYKGHEGNKVKYVCLDVKCNNKRQFCFKCLQDNLHNHGQENNKHMFNHTELVCFIKCKIEQQQNYLQQADEQPFVQQCIKVLNIIKLQIQNISDILTEFLTKSYIQNNIQTLQNQLEMIKVSKLGQVDDKFINELIRLNFQQKEKRYKMKQQIKEQCDLLLKNSIIIQQMSEQEIYIQKLKDVEYEIIQLDQETDQDIYSTTISNDSKYLVSSQKDKVLKIWNNINLKLIQEYNLKDRAHISKFTDDSRLLYLGSEQGILYCYDFYNNLKQIYKQKIHLNNILNLYCITNYIILTSSFDQRIIKTNTQLNQELLVIEAHDDRIDGLDYHRSKDIIASCSKDNFIKLWNNQNGQLLIQQYQPYQSIINQVLFIYNNDQLISLDSKSQINIWIIKYETKELLLIYTINDNNIIYNISLVLNQSFILLVCKECIAFYTIQGQFIHSIEHEVKEFYMIRGVQLESMKSIIVQGKRQLKLIKLKL